MNLDKYLLQKSNINKFFIKDFFSFYNKNKYAKFNPFNINLFDIIKWFDCEKEFILTLLIDNYQKNIDYIVQNNIVLISPNTLKLLCTLINTPNALQVNLNYLELENLSKLYLNNMTGGNKNEDVIIDIKELDEKITKTLSYYSDNIMWNIYNKPEHAYYHGKKISQKKLNSIVLDKTIGNKLLILPAHRYKECYKYLELLPKEYSYKDLFHSINNFYTKTILPLKELKKLPNDIDDYIKDAIKLAKENKLIYLIDIMGSLNRFESIEKIYGDVYRVSFGS